MTEPPSRNLHRSSTAVLSTILVLIGVALIVRTLTAGGGAIAFGLLLGVLFIAAGAGRLYINGLVGPRGRGARGGSDGSGGAGAR
jgi:hypothetical protein